MSPSRADTSIDLASEIRVLVARLHRRMRQEIHSSESDLTPARRAALFSIEQLGPVAIGDLAVAERTHPSTVTRIVDALEAQRLVTRSADPEDRRTVRVSITDHGRRVLEQGREASNAHISRQLGKLSRADKDRLTEVLPILRKLVEE